MATGGLPVRRRRHVASRNAGMLVAAQSCAGADRIGGFQPTDGDVFSTREYDFLVVGSGIAGLSFALKASAHGRVALITKADVHEGCTRYAQGGVCAVLDVLDCVESHIHDTMVAGAWLNDPK